VRGAKTLHAYLIAEGVGLQIVSPGDAFRKYRLHSTDLLEWAVSRRRQDGHHSEPLHQLLGATKRQREVKMSCDRKMANVLDPTQERD